MAADLEEIGLSAEELETWRAQAAARLEGVEEEEPFEVWPENEQTVRVFTACQWQMVGVGMSGARYVGIEASEVRNVMDILDVPADRRPDVLDGVRIMVSAALPLLNKER